MPGNFRKEDLRVAKTYNSLIEAMYESLARRNFSQITVNEICEIAQVSRTTFYAHFSDKYHLLQSCLTSCIQINNNPYLQIHSTLCELVLKRRKAIVNLLEDANSETYDTIYQFMSKMLKDADCRTETENAHIGAKRDMFLCFCAGGMVKYLHSQAKSNADETQMNDSSFDRLLEYVFKWDAKGAGGG